MNTQGRSSSRGRPLVACIGLAAALLVWAVPGKVAAQARPALVRSVDEPARVPYAHSLQPSCNFVNQCVSVFPAVPAGKRLRITNLQMFTVNTNLQFLFAIHRNAANSPLLMFTVSPVPTAYYGSTASTNQHVDLMFEAGDAPILEIGVAAGGGGVFVDARNRVGITGYLVDVAP